ncbi:MAG: T9SS type A sorting domain-containing protein [Bacteroidetes bacterium]|nr:T9SS type A sorting domain-containing protein [Bacteroidota bacterium]
MKTIFTPVLAALLLTTPLAAQLTFNRVDTIPVVANSQLLPFPWAGGMNFCQFSEIDLDQDGTMDLFSFDRTGNKILTWVNNGTPNQSDYRFAPEYINRFPLLHDWVLLRDYNCDGKMDIFSYSVAGFSVYKNISTLSSGLQFQMVSFLVYTNLSPNSTNFMSNLYVSAVDIPAIRDVDGDGDMDVLTFGIAGTTVEWHRNYSMETYGICDSLHYKLEDQCWGKFDENALNASITLGTTCLPPPIAPLDPAQTPVLRTGNNSRHAGSCIECINTNNDADLDLVIGDLTNPFMTYLRNGGTPAAAQMDLVDYVYPQSYSVNIPLFPCGYHLDIDNDGKKDLIFAPNAPNTSENHTSVWLYKNTGDNDSVVSSFVESNFLQKDMIDLGEGATPTLHDYDGDGDFDLFVGNYGYFNSAGAYPSKIALFRNNGTNASPIYQLLTTDFAGINALNLNIVAMAPTFGDIDGDGDKDLIVGDVVGKIHFFRKDPGQPDNFVLAGANYQGIDVGNFATPQLVDVDNDGKLDLLIGEQDGRVNYFRNTGTATAPQFTVITQFLGGVTVNQVMFTTGYSTPFLFRENGASVLLVGSERGYLFRYDNIDNNLTGTFTLTDSVYIDRRFGSRIAPTGADINNDGVIDLIIGNYSGGLHAFWGDNNVSTGGEINNETVAFTLFPNPATAQVQMQTTATAVKPSVLRMYNINGQLVHQEMLTSPLSTVNTGALVSGMYICQITTHSGATAHRRLIIQ